MFFLNQAKDTPLLQELLREGVFTSAFWEALPLPADGHLMDVLIAHAGKVPERPWLDWLIRKHNCTRIPGLEPTPAFIKSTDRRLLTDSVRYDCYPLSLGENHIYVGIGRPDYPQHPPALCDFFKKKVIYRNALTIKEIERLRSLCGQALQSL